MDALKDDLKKRRERTEAQDTRDDICCGRLRFYESMKKIKFTVQIH